MTALEAEMREDIAEMVKELEVFAEKHDIELTKVHEKAIYDVRYHTWKLTKAAKSMAMHDDIITLSINTNLTYKLVRELEIYYGNKDSEGN